MVALVPVVWLKNTKKFLKKPKTDRTVLLCYEGQYIRRLSYSQEVNFVIIARGFLCEKGKDESFYTIRFGTGASLIIPHAIRGPPLIPDPCSPPL